MPLIQDQKNETTAHYLPETLATLEYSSLEEEMKEPQESANYKYIYLRRRSATKPTL